MKENMNDNNSGTKYFIDTEFIETFTKPFIGKSRHYIELVSIGIVSEHNAGSYSAISKEYNYKAANAWVKKNVIEPLWLATVPGPQRDIFRVDNFHKYYGKPNKQIAQEIVELVGQYPEFYGYFSDYDWVLVCSLYGTMMDLPEGWPMYCNDLKQTLDEIALEYYALSLPIGTSVVNAKDKAIAELKSNINYPKEPTGHLAMADAVFNKKLFLFLQSISTNK